jgi:hypothetical protein
MPEKKKFLLRLDDELFEAMEHWAADEFRSINAQIEYVLREAARKNGRIKKSARPSSGEPPKEE